MSRIGRMPITVPAGVEVTVAENNVVTVKGPKGTLTQALRPEMIIEQEGNVIHVKRPSDDKMHCCHARHDPRSAAQHGRRRQRRLQEGRWRSTASAIVPPRKATSWS